MATKSNDNAMHWSMSVMLVAVALLLTGTLSTLLLSQDGLRRTQRLQAEVQMTRQELVALEARNQSLLGEVRNLKRGLDAAEERARADLGLIGPNESFYQIIESD